MAYRVLLSFGISALVITLSSSPRAEPQTSGGDRCVVADGAITLRLTTPPGSYGRRCDTQRSSLHLFEGSDLESSPLIFQVFVIANDDAGPEQLLNEQPDGARRWALQTGLRGQPQRSAGEGEVTVAGQRTRYYRLLGRPPGLDGEKEILVARVTQGRYNVVIMAIYAAGDASRLQRSLQLLQSLAF